MAYRKKKWRDPRIQIKDGRRAIVSINGGRVYLGRWDGLGQPPAGVWSAYLRAVAGGRAEFEGIAPRDTPQIVTVQIAVDQYLHAMADVVDGYGRPDGSLSGHHAQTAAALRPLLAACGDLPLAAAGLAEFRLVRQVMQSRSLSGGSADTAGLPSLQVTRPGINRRLGRIKRFFAWCQAQGWITADRLAALKSLPGLRKGHTAAPEPEARDRLVDDRDLAVVTAFVSPVIAAMLETARLTAARPSEVCRLRVSVPGQPDRGIFGIAEGAEVWEYRPEVAKGDHLEIGANRVIFLGPAAQAILRPWLERPAEAYLFTPAESAAWWRARVGRGGPSGRVEPPPRYDQAGFRRAVQRGILRARRAGNEVPDWTPYDLRHTRATELAAAGGIRSAQATLGHRKLATTAIYAHELEATARAAALEAGGPAENACGPDDKRLR